MIAATEPSFTVINVLFRAQKAISGTSKILRISHLDAGVSSTSVFVMLKTLRDALIAIIVERSVNWFAPTLLPYAWTAILLWLTWDIFRLEAVQKQIAGAYSHLRIKMNFGFIIFFLLAGGLGVLYFSLSRNLFQYGVSKGLIKTEKTDSQTNQRIDELSRQIREFAQSPSVDSGVRLKALKQEHDELSEKKDQLTSKGREILDNQAIGLNALESGRQQYIAQLEIEKRQKEIAQQQEEIQRQDAQKRAQEELDSAARKAATSYAPIVDYAIAKLHDALSELSKEFSKPLYSDFPGDRPSIYRSSLLKDQKLVDGEHIIRLGSEKDWEFRIKLYGRTKTSWRTPNPNYLGFRIESGDPAKLSDQPGRVARVIITNHQSPSPPSAPLQNPMVRVAFLEGDKETYSEDCELSAYQNPVQQAIKRLIQDRYNQSPLNGGATPPSLTPGKEGPKH